MLQTERTLVTAKRALRATKASWGAGRPRTFSKPSRESLRPKGVNDISHAGIWMQ
jgi:hypothetical protein